MKKGGVLAILLGFLLVLMPTYVCADSCCADVPEDGACHVAASCTWDEDVLVESITFSGDISSFFASEQDVVITADTITIGGDDTFPIVWSNVYDSVLVINARSLTCSHARFDLVSRNQEQRSNSLYINAETVNFDCEIYLYGLDNHDGDGGDAGNLIIAVPNHEHQTLRDGMGHDLSSQEFASEYLAGGQGFGDGNEDGASGEVSFVNHKSYPEFLCEWHGNSWEGGVSTQSLGFVGGADGCCGDDGDADLGYADDTFRCVQHNDDSYEWKTLSEACVTLSGVWSDEVLVDGHEMFSDASDGCCGDDSILTVRPFLADGYVRDNEFPVLNIDRATSVITGGTCLDGICTTEYYTVYSDEDYQTVFGRTYVVAQEDTLDYSCYLSPEDSDSDESIQCRLEYVSDYAYINQNHLCYADSALGGNWLWQYANMNSFRIISLDFFDDHYSEPMRDGPRNIDADDDGYPVQFDCDDSYPEINSGADFYNVEHEIWGWDYNCDGEIEFQNPVLPLGDDGICYVVDDGQDDTLQRDAWYRVSENVIGRLRYEIKAVGGSMYVPSDGWIGATRVFEYAGCYNGGGENRPINGDDELRYVYKR